MKDYSGLEIAIIGMAGKFPGAGDVQAFWNNLANGVETISFFTDEELIKAGVDKDLIDDPLYVKANGLLEDKDCFDSSFFNYRPDEARLMEPQMRIFHECVWAALEDAGWNPDDEKDKVGLYAGADTNINWEVYAQLANRKGYVDGFSVSFLANPKFLSTKISYNLNLKGPSVYLDTACSTSLVAVHHACRSLLLGECNMAVAGGVHVTGKLRTGYKYQEGMVNSRDGHCRTFDDAASGTVGGEGAGAVVLKTLKNALKDGDHIWAIIKGSGINNDGSDKVGYTAPSINGQVEAILMAQKWAKVAAESISYIEAHGTATRLGDPVEVEALVHVFGKSREKYCALGSVKSNIGHLDAAAGIAGLIKTVLAIKHRQIPPSLHFQTLNREIDLGNTPFYVNNILREWRNDKYPLRAGISSFGIGGTNAHVILEEAPQISAVTEGMPNQVLTLSAKTPAALERLTKRFCDYLNKNEEDNLQDVAYTLQTGRRHHPYRKCLVCSSRSEALNLLVSGEAIGNDEPVTDRLKSRRVFMFSGQGSQYMNMCYDLYVHEPLFKEEVDRCLRIIEERTHKDLLPVLFSEDAGDAHRINNTEYTQPLLFVIEYALARLLMKWGVMPDLMIGHSIGEYVAACISGVFSLEDALWLVMRRGELMQGAPAGIMMSVSISPDILRTMLGDYRELSLAAVNSQSSCVVSGAAEAIHVFKEMLTKEGFQSKALRTSHAFHSYMMDGILESFREEVKKVTIHPPKIPFVSNLTGDWVNGTEISRPEYWTDHLRQAVLFSDGVQKILENDRVMLIEVGPGRSLCTLARSNKMRTKNHKVFQLVRSADEGMSDVQFLLTTLGRLWLNGGGPQWSLMHQKEARRKVSLPVYPFEKTRYPVHVDPFRTLADEAAGDHVQKKGDIADWMYVPSWKMVPRLSNLMPHRSGGWTLLFADNCGIGMSLALEYKKNDQNIIYITAGESYRKKGEGIYEVCPSAKSDFTMLFADLVQQGISPDGIIHAWGVTNSEENGVSADALHLGFFSLVEIVHALRHYGELAGRRLILLTSGAHRVFDEKQEAGISSMTAALLIVLSQEFQGVSTSHIDISLSDASVTKFHHWLYQEIQMARNGIVICLRRGKRWQQMFEKVRPAGDGMSGGHFRKGGVYLITGGSGNMGFNIASHLIAKFNARVMLLGRSKHPSPEKMKLLQQLQAQGGEVLYLQANVTDLAALGDAVRKCEEVFGKLNGVIHAAGITAGPSFNSVKALGRDDFYAQFEAKAQGLQALSAVIGDMDLDFCLVASSLSTVLGGKGFGAYAPANAFMDHYIDAHKSNGKLENWVSVNFDGFDLEKENTDTITCREMIAVLDQILSLKECPRIVVSAFDLQRRIEKWVLRSGLEKKDKDLQGDEYNDEITRSEVIVPAHGSDPLTSTLLNLWQSFFGREDITAEDDFFELGGDSLKAITMTGRIYKVVNIEIPVKEFFSRSSVNRLVEFINSERAAREDHKEYQAIPKSPVQDGYPLSSTQRRLYFLFEFNRSSLAYNLPRMVNIKGVIDIERIRQIINIIARRHEILRTYVGIDGESHVQRIAEDINIPVEHFKATAEKVAAVVHEFVRPFDLTRGPLIRVGLIEIDKDDHVFLIDIHHFISDGASLNILLKEFATLYRGEELEEQVLQYRDYAVWQISEIYQQGVARERSWWLQEFNEDVTSLDFPTDHGRPVVLNHAGDEFDFLLNEREMGSLKEIADAQGATTFMVLLSVYSILLGKLTGQEDVVIGTPTSGRNHADLENIMGMFANTLAIRTRPNGALSYREFLKQLKSNILTVFDQQAYPYELLIKDLKVERDTSRNPLFDVFLSYDNRIGETFELPGLDISPFHTRSTVSQFDLSLNANERNGSMRLSFVYSTELFKQETIERFAGYLQQIVSVIISDPNRTISSIDILSEKERSLLINSFNDTKSIYPAEETIISLFEKQAKLTPDKIAVVYESRRLTYRELNERSNQLAYCLREQYRIDREQVVGIMMERSEKMMISIFGILKAGGAYLPIDPVYPKERVEYILKDSGAGVLLVDESAGNSLEYEGMVVSVDIAINENKHDKDLNIDLINTSRDLCYLIYTSGSTGRPKGVMISHYNVVNFFYAMHRRLPVSHEDSMLAVTSTAFDISVLELLWTLCSGVEVVIHPSDISLHSLDRYLEGENRSLDFSLFFFSSYNNTEKDKYSLLLESVKYADREGFKAVWTPERHFHEFGGLYPNPAVLSSALAMITKEIEIRSGSVVSPLHDAARIAEEWSLVDNLSNGRVGLSFASGWNPNDFVLARTGYSDRQKTMYGQIEEVKKLWKGEYIKRKNGVGQEVQLRIFPEPVQKELPVWITSSGNEETFKSAGAIGANILTHLLGQNIEDLERKIKIYRASLTEYGFDGSNRKVTLMLHTYIGEDIDEVERLVEGPFIEYLTSSIGLSKIMLEESGLKEDEISDETKGKIFKNAFRRYYETGSLIGTKSSCEKLILKLKKIGVDEIACLIDFGIEESKVLEGLKNLASLKNLHISRPAMVHKPITLMQSTPSFIKAAMESEASRKFFSSLRLLLVGGEPVPSPLVRELTNVTSADIYNMYGPTETTIWSCMHKFGKNGEKVSVGAPILNTQIYILDKDHHLLPVGVAGEVYIGGEGISRGYWKRPDLTMERFINSPFVDGEKIYKTGDIGRWSWDGNIELLGREDQQVKIKGYRIELGEIESRLLTFSNIREAAVVVKRGREEGDKVLVAYIVTEGAVDVPAVKRYLGDSLPHYMIPVYFVALSRLPLTPNGKLDRKALPDPEIRVTEDYVIPQTKNERILADVWSKVLGVEKISITDNFFSIGGDSIKSIQIISRMRAAGYEVSVKDILISQTIKQLALSVREVVSISDQRAVTGVSVLTPVQQLFFEGPVKKKHHFNQSVMLNFPSGIRADLVKDIFSMILEHHDALRMVFTSGRDGEGVMENRPVGAETGFMEYDLRGESEALSLLPSICNEIQVDGNLQSGPLMRLGLFHMKDGSRLLIVIHHLIVDGISWRILFEDIETLYLQLSNNKPLKLPHKTDAFLAWSAHLTAYIKSESYRKAMQFWESQFKKVICPIPRDLEEGEGIFQYNRTESFRLSKNITTSLLTQSHWRLGTRINDLLLTAFFLSVRQQYGISAVQVDMEGHGREEIAAGFDFSRTIGWFTSVYPVVLQSDEESLSAIIKEVKERLRQIPNNGIDYGIRRYLDRAGTGERHLGPSRIIFNYLGQFDADLQGNVYGIASEMPLRGSERDREEINEYDWEISGMVVVGELEMKIHYSEQQYDPGTIRSLMNSYKQNLEQIIAWCISVGKKEFTPSDLTYKSLPAKWLDSLQDRYALEDVYPLSPMQEGMLFHSLLDEQGTVYFEQTNCIIVGALQIGAIEQSMNDIIARHVALRTAFIDEYDYPLQVVLQERKIDFLFKDCRTDCESEGREEVISRWREHDRSRKFDLSKDVLMRLTVLQLTEKEYEFIFSYHHVLMDGWCMGLIMTEFMELYRAYSAGEPMTLPAVKPFSSYIAWLESRRREDSASYWRKYLSGYEQLASIARSVNTLQVWETDHANEQLILSRSLTRQIQDLSVRHGITINTILQTAWGILLSKYNDTCDVVFGAVVSVRPSEIEGIETMVGLFINTIPVRVMWNEQARVSDVLRNIQEAALDAEPYYHHSLPEIQTLSSLGRNLLDHILVFENFPLSKVVRNAEDNGLALSITDVQLVGKTNYDLTVTIVPGEEIVIHFKYLSRICEKKYIQRVASHLHNILQQMVMEGDMTVAGIETITDAEQRELLQFHGKATILPERSFIQLFEDQVMQTPDQYAVADERGKITYKELNDSSEAFAGLIAETQDTGGMIALYAEPSIEMVTGMLAILKTGKAFLPLDPAMHTETQQRILRESNTSLMLTQQSIRGHLQFEGGVITLDQKPAMRDKNVMNPMVSPDNIAYVIYTSGTTGQRKGALIKHRNLVNYVEWFKEMMPIGVMDRSILTSSFAFDLGYSSIFPILASGGTLHVIPSSLYQSPGELLHYISVRSISFLKLTPTLFKAIIMAPSFGSHSLEGLKWVVLGGEPIVPDDVETAKKVYGHLQFINHYGPAETTIGVIAHKIEDWRRYKRRPFIGRPIYNTEIFILDKYQKLLPVGIPGELCIGGVSVGAGYLDRSDLTREKFISYPLSKNGRIYRTGDRARWMPDGTVELLGRMDNQVKIRGFRVELGEVESYLSKYPQIQDTVVVCREIKGEKCLIAYYLAENGISVSRLREFLGSKLPDYMLPAYYVHMDKWPLSPNGKLDRKALPEPDTTAITRFVAAPRTKEEELLVEAWAQLLGREKKRIGIDDDFFELGGHSLVAIRLIYLIRQKFSVDLAMRQIFEHPSIRKLTRLIRSAKKHRVRSIQKVEKREYYPVSSAQERLFYEQLLNKDIPIYNTCTAFKIEGQLDIDRLKNSFQSLVMRHEGLRTGFILTDGGVVQVINEAPGLDLIDLDATKYATIKEAFDDFVKPFDLAASSLMRCGLLQHRSEGNILFVDIHHIVCDGISKNTLMNDFKCIYNGAATEPLELRYVDYAWWQRNQNGHLREQKEFWIRSLGERTIKPDLPVVHNNGQEENHYAAMEVFQLADEIVTGIRELAKSSEVSVFMILLSAYYLLLSKVSGSTDIVIGTEGSGRTHDELRNVVGSFVNILPMRMQVRPDLPFADFLKEVRECVLQSFENQDFQYDQIVAAVREINESYGNLIDAHFAFANTLYSTVETDELQFIPIEGLWTETTHYELSLQVSEERNTLHFYFIYSTGYFDKGTIQLLMDYYKRILSDVLKQTLYVEYAD